MRRLLAATLLLLLALPAAPSQAAGTGGIEVSPYPGVVGGRQVTAFHVSDGSATVQYSLRNTTGKAVKGRMYAASATPDGNGGWTIGDAGSTTELDLADQQVSLAPKETRLASFRTRFTGDHAVHAAVVVEVKQGAVVSRAATLVYLSPGDAVPMPVLVVASAVLLLLLAGAGVVWARRRPAPFAR